MAGWRILVAVVVALAVSACGSAAKKEKAQTPATTQATGSTSAAVDTTPAGVERCLTQAGLKVDISGDTPIIARSKAVGVRLPGGANIMPGNLSAAIFWFGTGAQATSMWKSSQRTFPAVDQIDKIVVVYNPIPSAEAQKKVEACIGGGA